MIRKISFIVNYNPYDTFRYYIKEFADAMKRRGIATQILDLNEKPIDLNIALKIKQFKPDLTCAFNPSSASIKNRPFREFLQIPHYTVLVDPAFYYMDDFDRENCVYSNVDHNETDLLLKNGLNAFFLPHACSSQITYNKNKNRTYEVVFIGSCYDYESIRLKWQKLYGEKIGKMIDHAAEIAVSDLSTPVYLALEKAIIDSQLPQETINVKEVFSLLDHYIRGKERVKILRSFKGIPVHVFGDLLRFGVEESHLGWEYYLKGTSNVTIHPPLTLEESIEILKESSICLNSMPFFKNGSHERVFNSLACGVLPITMDSPFWKEHFGVDELVTYSSVDHSQLPELVHHYLNNEKERLYLVEKGHDKVMKFHTWENRVDELQFIASK